MNVLSSLLNFIGNKISDFDTRITALRNDFTALTTRTELTITRVIGSTYMTDTDFNRIHAFKKNGMSYLCFNAQFSAAYTATSYTTIATISGWNAIYDAYVTVPNQNDSSKIMTLLVTPAGEVKVYSTTAISGWHRAIVCIPYNS